MLRRDLIVELAQRTRWSKHEWDAVFETVDRVTPNVVEIVRNVGLKMGASPRDTVEVLKMLQVSGSIKT